MRLHLQAEAGHAKGVLNAFLPIHDIAAWNDMDHFAVRRNGNRSRNLYRSADIVLDDIPVAWRDRHEALTVLRTNMAACDTHIRCGDLFSREAFCTIERRGNGSDRLLDIHHHPTAQPL